VILIAWTIRILRIIHYFLVY